MMNRCRHSFIKGEPQDPPPVKAILLSILSCLLFIGFISAISRIGSPNRRVTYKHINASPPRPAEFPAPEPPLPPDANARYRVIPANFEGINFATRSYGNYRMSNGTNRDLVLIDGQFRDFGNSQQWFDLNDVYYTDLTGDGNPEAIVMMTHLECGRTCDGGKNLVYAYSQNYPMQEILKYETGSGLDGCSLKSLTVKNTQLTLELFGRCPQPAGTSRDFVRHETYDVTRIDFFFNGKQLVPKPSAYLTLPDNNQVSNGVEVRISENKRPAEHEL